MAASPTETAIIAPKPEDAAMNRLQRAAVLLTMLDALKQRGSWCGETHLQKSVYFLQELFGVPLGFTFVLYRHGPYSFDLSDEITALRADLLLDVQPAQPYGPSLVPGENAARFLANFELTRGLFPADRVRGRASRELQCRRPGEAGDGTIRDSRVENDDGRAIGPPVCTSSSRIFAIEDAERAVGDVDAMVRDGRARVQPDEYTYPKRLIEVDLPIARISAHARREKSIRHGHISTLHIWWARRPLAACRAVICAALWPDPADPLCPHAFREAAPEGS